MIGIYKITNTINGKCYIGQSVNIERRLEFHKKLLSYGNHPNNHMQNSVNKYNIDNFTFEIIEECDKSKLSDRERYWISHYNSMNEGYNMTSGGENIPGWQQTDEVRLKISEALKINNPMKRKEVSKKANSDRIWLETSREKISKANSNPSPERRARISTLISKRNKDRIWINNGIDNKFIEKSDIEKYPNWTIGRLNSNEGRKGLIFVNNGKENRQIHQDEIEYYLSLGYTRGMKKKNFNKSWMNDGTNSFYVNSNEIDLYLSKGYKRGRASRKKVI